MDRILASNWHPEQGFRSCLGIVRLGNKYTHPRVEAAARRAVTLNVCTYQSLKSILENNLESKARCRSPRPAHRRPRITPICAAPAITTPADPANFERDI